MNQSVESFTGDVQRIQALEIVPSILDLICRTTGMGFSAIARVTKEKWIACAVKDDINFGLIPGSELQIGTTICNEIRDHGTPVIIDEVCTDNEFKDHHTPKKYGFQSYISVPIILKDGTFFGTLCAIDPRPFPLKEKGAVTMFNLYADLISYHLQTQDQLDKKSVLLKATEAKLKDSQDDVRQYSYINDHTLQEPLRKLRIFTDVLMHHASAADLDRVRDSASKVNKLAATFTLMMKELTIFSEAPAAKSDFQFLNLNIALNSAVSRLREKIEQKKAKLQFEMLHTIWCSPQQLAQIFFYMLDNALSYSRPNVTPVVKIYSKLVDKAESDGAAEYCEVCFEDNGIGISKNHLEQIFDLFVHLNPKEYHSGLGMGLSQARKIMRNHEGTILVKSELGTGSTFSLLFPVVQQAVETADVIEE
jgi:signal transduction histidine kinase